MFKNNLQFVVNIIVVP